MYYFILQTYSSYAGLYIQSLYIKKPFGKTTTFRRNQYIISFLSSYFKAFQIFFPLRCDAVTFDAF